MVNGWKDGSVRMLERSMARRKGPMGWNEGRDMACGWPLRRDGCRQNGRGSM